MLMLNFIYDISISITISIIITISITFSINLLLLLVLAQLDTHLTFVILCLVADFHLVLNSNRILI